MCQETRDNLTKRRRRGRKTTVFPKSRHERVAQWARKWEEDADIMFPRPIKKDPKLEKNRRIIAHWRTILGSKDQNSLQGYPLELNRGILNLYTKLKKAESTLLVQMRSGFVGLAATLRQLRVPGFESGICKCGRARETIRHLLVFCHEENHRREGLITDGRLDVNKLINTEAGAAKVTRWVIQSKRLGQFDLAGVLLYS
jgi:hypothetical protein